MSRRKDPEQRPGPDRSEAPNVFLSDDWDHLFDPEATDAISEPALDVTETEAEVSLESRFLGFRLGPEHYAIPILELSEVVKARSVTPVPRLRSFVRGIVSVRGNIVPIIDLRARLAQSGDDGSTDPGERPASDSGDGTRRGAEGRPARQRILITRRSGEPFGLLVDEVTEAFWLEPDEIEPPPQALPRRLLDFVSGIARVGRQIYIVLEMDTILRFDAVRRGARSPEIAP